MSSSVANSVADPDPGFGALLTPGSGILDTQKVKIRSPGMNILDHISESLETIFWVKILQFFDADADPGSGNLFDPRSGMEKFRIRDKGWKKFGSGIRDKHPGSAKLVAKIGVRSAVLGGCPELFGLFRS